MLLLIWKVVVYIVFIFAYLNTSNVTVNQANIKYIVILQEYLNTSNVTVNL